MVQFLVQRISASVIVLLCLSLVTFVIIHARPGDYGD